MATPDLPAPPPAADDRPLPLPPPIPSVGRLLRPGRRPILGSVVAGVVLLFAFLASSFVARNSDFWLHLASGRLLAGGNVYFGSDPFAYTPHPDSYWANHSWLFDGILYALYGLVGGAGLVVLKALVVAVLAGVMLRFRRPEAGPMVPATSTTLALLVMSPRLLLQPVVLSYFFLGLTLWFLWRSGRDAPAWKRFGPLLLLCVLWVNVDSWFLLGPLLVGLFWLGERLEAFLPGDRPESARRIPAWMVPGSLAACLLNPHHFHAFTLPAELSPVLARSGLRLDVRFHRAFASPWEMMPPAWPIASINLAEWAYFALVLLGLASLVLNRKNLCGWRLLAWLVFAALGAWQARLVPFFAVVAGPITALNVQDFLARFGRQRASRAGRVAFLTSGAVLLVLAAFGWLQGFTQQGRHVAWGVQADPSLRRVAETLAAWHRQGRLTDGDHVFHVHPDAAHYCAWFCPGVKGFFDHRLSLFPQAARAYEGVCQELLPSLAVAGREHDVPQLPGGWQQVFRDHKITLLVLSDPDLPRLLSAVTRLVRDPQQWTLLPIEGQAVIFGWRGARGGKGGAAFADLEFDANRLAYGFGDEDAERALPPAPGHGPGRGPQGRPVWRQLGKVAPLPAWESAAAAVYDRLFEDRTRQHRLLYQVRGWRAYAAGLAGRLATPAHLGQLFPLVRPSAFFGDYSRPAALPLLTVRAARRALADNPEDANAYLCLGRAYLDLRGTTAEHSWDERRFPPLSMLRHVQLVTALEQVLVLDPDREEAHAILAELYTDRNYLDSGLDHRRAEARLRRRGGPRSGEDARTFTHRLAQLDAQVQKLEGLVQDQQTLFATRAESPGSDPLRQARLALELGLPRQALDKVLLPSDVRLFGGEGARMEIELLLMLGRAEEARPLLDTADTPQGRPKLGLFDLGGGAVVYRLPSYEWLRACQAAATGDYDQASVALGEIQSTFAAVERHRFPLLRRALPLALAAELGVLSQPHALIPRGVARRDREAASQELSRTLLLKIVRADVNTLSGMLALERGTPREALRHFQQARALGGAEGAAGLLASAYRQQIERQQKILGAKRGGP